MITKNDIMILTSLLILYILCLPFIAKIALSNKEHNDDVKEDGCPISIMRSWAFNQEEIQNCYIPLHGDYIKELF